VTSRDQVIHVTNEKSTQQLGTCLADADSKKTPGVNKRNIPANAKCRQ